MSRIKGAPTPGLSYNPNDAVYWDRHGLEQELERAFEICHGCRLCFNLCPSFPELFNAVDGHDGDVRKLTEDSPYKGPLDRAQPIASGVATPATNGVCGSVARGVNRTPVRRPETGRGAAEPRAAPAGRHMSPQSGPSRP
jgi:hypothetical protein